MKKNGALSVRHIYRRKKQKRSLFDIEKARELRTLECFFMMGIGEIWRFRRFPSFFEIGVDKGKTRSYTRSHKAR